MITRADRAAGLIDAGGDARHADCFAGHRLPKTDQRAPTRTGRISIKWRSGESLRLGGRSNCSGDRKYRLAACPSTCQRRSRWMISPLSAEGRAAIGGSRFLIVCTSNDEGCRQTAESFARAGAASKSVAHRSFLGFSGPPVSLRITAVRRANILVEHDLFGKPVSTFPDHALNRGSRGLILD